VYGRYCTFPTHPFRNSRSTSTPESFKKKRQQIVLVIKISHRRHHHIYFPARQKRLLHPGPLSNPTKFPRRH
jgi:hypothetical protein